MVSKNGKVKRIILLAVSAMLFTALLSLQVSAESDDEYVKELTAFGTGIIDDPVEGKDYEDWEKSPDWQGNYVYFGQHVKNKTGSKDGNEPGTENTPLKFRVLDSETTEYNKDGDSERKTMLLDCNRGLDTNYQNIDVIKKANVVNQNYFDESVTTSDWGESPIKKFLNSNPVSIGGKETDISFLGLDIGGIHNFTPVEREAIAESYKKDDDAPGFVDENAGRMDFAPLNGEKIFLLDAREATRAEYGYSPNASISSNTRVKDIPVTTSSGVVQGTHVLWTRTAGPDINKNPGTLTPTVCVILSNGNMGFMDVNSSLWSTPAFNIDISKVFFVSLVEGEQGKPGAAYKLTLNDSNLKVTTGEVKRTGNTIYVPYTEKTEDCNRLSVLITDKKYSDPDVKVIEYGELSLTDPGSDSGTGVYNLKNKDISDYFAYIIPENAGDRYHTDYAGEPVTINTPPWAEITVTFDWNNGSGKTTEIKANDSGMLDRLPDDPEWEGYRFDGWFTEKSGGDKITPDRVYTENTTVYAHWTSTEEGSPNDITVTLPGLGVDGRSITIRIKYPAEKVSYNGLRHIKSDEKASGKKCSDLKIGVNGLPGYIKVKYKYGYNKNASETKPHYSIKLSADVKSVSYNELEKSLKKKLKKNIRSSNKILRKKENRMYFPIDKLDFNAFSYDSYLSSKGETVFLRKDGSGDKIVFTGRKRVYGYFGEQRVRLWRKDYNRYFSDMEVKLTGKNKNITGEMTGIRQ